MKKYGVKSEVIEYNAIQKVKINSSWAIFQVESYNECIKMNEMMIASAKARYKTSLSRDTRLYALTVSRAWNLKYTKCKYNRNAINYFYNYIIFLLVYMYVFYDILHVYNNWIVISQINYIIYKINYFIIY
jgi:hypothetical protein